MSHEVMAALLEAENGMLLSMLFLLKVDDKHCLDFFLIVMQFIFKGAVRGCWIFGAPDNWTV